MRRAAAGGRRRGRPDRPRADRHAPAPGSRPPKGPRGPQWRKRTAAQGADGQAAVQCKRTGDPTALGGPPKRSRSEPEARRRYYRSIEGKGRLGLCPSAAGEVQKVPLDFPVVSLSAADMERMSLGEFATRHSRAPAAHQQRGLPRPSGSAAGLLNGVPVRTSLFPEGAAPPSSFT